MCHPAAGPACRFSSIGLTPASAAGASLIARTPSVGGGVRYGRARSAGAGVGVDGGRVEQSTQGGDLAGEDAAAGELTDTFGAETETSCGLSGGKEFGSHAMRLLES